ncbi:MFS transporter [Sinobaca sp. H24]|uniref:MFS transporter n=1 Tax=Sinobaca sp. H24 TaxID=2923376 RepID=UPI0020795431|nr:MFS transporter [Sinobaca sp. H24]
MWKIIFPGIAMIGIVYAFARFSFGLFLPDISESLALSESQAGIVGSAAYAAYTAALCSAYIFIHTFTARRVVLLAGATALLGMIGIAFSTGFYILMISVFSAGLGSGWASPAFSQVISQSLTSSQQNKGNTWINTGTSFGLMVTGPIVLLFTDQWRWSYLLFAFITMIVWWWNAAVLEKEKKKISAVDQKTAWPEMLKKGRFLIAASLGVGFSSSIYWTFSRSYVAVIHEFTMNQSIIFWIVMGAAGIIGGTAGGIIQKTGLSFAYRGGVFVTAASIICLTIPVQPAVYLSAVLFGISYIFMTGLFIVWATSVFSDFPSLGVSLSFLALGVGQALGSGAGGIIIERASYPFAFITFSLLGMFFIVCRVEERKTGTKGLNEGRFV